MTLSSKVPLACPASVSVCGRWFFASRLLAFSLLLISAELCTGAGAEDATGSYKRPVLAGDRLQIEIRESPDMNGTYSVAGDGSIDFPLLGRVSVAELLPEEVAEKIETMLENKDFKRATVSLRVAEFVEGGVLVQGEVNTPQELGLSDGSFLTLMEAIAKCGGLTTRAAPDRVRIIRWKPAGGLQREVITVDVSAMINDQDFRNDQFLRPRDIVLVPSLGAEGGGEYLVLGQVGSAGFYPATEGITIIRAITMAGGVTLNAKMESARILRPEKSGQYRVMPVDLARLFGAADMSMNYPVLSGDILFVPSTSQGAGDRVYLLGAVGKTGAIDIPSGKDATLAKIILGVGGMSQFADGSKVKILRTAPDGSKQSLLVDVERILKKGLFEEDVQLRNEDVIIVPERGFL